jgi:hypothetical protein
MNTTIIIAILLAATNNTSDAPGKVTGAIMVVVGAVCAVLSIGSQTRVGGAFTHGKGPTVPINRAGRVILFAAGLVLIITGLQGLRS